MIDQAYCWITKNNAEDSRGQPNPCSCHLGHDYNINRCMQANPVTKKTYNLLFNGVYGLSQRWTIKKDSVTRPFTYGRITVQKKTM